MISLARRPGLLVALSLSACSSGPPVPAALDARHDACAHCRMVVSDQRFAAQLVAPAEEPKFFDDIGCLRAHLTETRPLPRGAVAYVADHRSRAWVRAAAALYTLDAKLETPMSSHIIAHADAASRDQDPATGRGEQLSAKDVFGPSGPPDGGR